jgi:hypothetical protein
MSIVLAGESTMIMPFLTKGIAIDYLEKQANRGLPHGSSKQLLSI